MLEKEKELVEEPTDPPDNQNNSGNAATPNLNLDSVDEEPNKADPPDNQRNSGG